MASRELNVPFSRQWRSGQMPDLENGTHALCARAIFKVRSHGYQPLSYIEKQVHQALRWAAAALMATSAG